MRNKYLDMLREIKEVSMASVDRNGDPQVRIIDVMLVEGDTLYFCTARGKDFYDEIITNKKIAITGMNKNYQMIRLDGTIEKVEDKKHWLDKIFAANPSMNQVYPGETRKILEPLCIRNGTIEFFDLSKKPIYREYNAIGTEKPKIRGFEITDECVSCGTCAANCPQKCLIPGIPFKIQQEHCLHCGACFEVCPVQAVKRI